MSLYALCLYNGESDHLSKSLQYTSKVADKIFLFSRKEKIASLKKLGLNKDKYSIHEVEWNHDFSEIRNYALEVILSQSTYKDWILVIDSDECIDPKECWKINSFLDMYGDNPKINGFSFNIINNSKYWLSDHTGNSGFSVRKLKRRDVRLIRAIPSVRYDGRICESCNINPTLVCELDINIYHHAYRYTESEEQLLIERQNVLDKWNRISENEWESYKKEEKLLEKMEQKIMPLRKRNDKPKIGFFTLHYEPPIGGAERSMHNYFVDLKEDYDITVFCFLNDDGNKFNFDKNIQKDGINISQCKDDIPMVVNRFVRDNPDIIITQLLCSELVIDIAYRNNIPCIYFAHSLFEDICPHYLLPNICPETDLATCGFGSHCANAKRHMVHLEKYSRCHSVICNSYYTKKIFDRFFPSISDKIKVIPPNFRYDIFKPEDVKGSENRRTVLAVNSSQQKGRNVILNAAYSNPEINFIWIDTKERDFSGIAIPKNMDCRKKVSKEEMAKLYNKVDAVIYPSLMDETFGGVVCESVLSGTPVVCSNKGNLPDMVVEGKTGFIVSSYDKKDWSDAIQKAFDLSPSAEIRENLRKSLDTKKNLNEIKNVINSCLKINENNEIYISDRDGSSENLEASSVMNNGKKILFFARYFYPPLGGGEYFLLTVLKHLKDKGYNCKAICYFSGSDDKPFLQERNIEWKGIPLRQSIVRSKMDIQSIMKEELPDLVITQSFEALQIVESAKEVGAKTILGTHFWRNICSVKDTFLNMLTRPGNEVEILKPLHKVFDVADELYVNSKFMQLGVEKYVGKKIERIIHPILDVDRISSKDCQGKYITIVNPDYYKGGAFFVELSHKMKTYPFMSVGSAPNQDMFHKNQKINEIMMMSHNIKVVEQSDDMSSVYGNTSILLVPSIVDETFSMVALEAMYNGIPVIASNNGNLPYLMEGAGINLDMDVDLWVENIKTIYDDESYYESVSNSCKKRSRDFLPEIELRKFEEMVESCIGKAK